MQVDPTFLRTARGDMSRRELAEKAAVAQQTIKRLENEPGAGTTYETIQALASALGVPFEQLASSDEAVA